MECSLQSVNLSQVNNVSNKPKIHLQDSQCAGLELHHCLSEQTILELWNVWVWSVCEPFYGVWPNLNGNIWRYRYTQLSNPFKPGHLIQEPGRKLKPHLSLQCAASVSTSCWMSLMLAALGVQPKVRSQKADVNIQAGAWYLWYNCNLYFSNYIYNTRGGFWSLSL